MVTSIHGATRNTVPEQKHLNVAMLPHKTHRALLLKWHHQANDASSRLPPRTAYTSDKDYDETNKKPVPHFNQQKQPTFKSEEHIVNGNTCSRHTGGVTPLASPLNGSTAGMWNHLRRYCRIGGRNSGIDAYGWYRLRYESLNNTLKCNSISASKFFLHDIMI